MADEEKDTEVEEPQKKKSPVILIAVLVLVGLVLAGGISFFVTTRMMANSGGDDEGESRHHDPGVFIKIGDPKEGILVNVGGARSGKYLKAGIVLEMNPGKSANVTEDGKLQLEAETKIQDMVMQFLRACKLEEFDADKQDELKKNLKDQLNAMLGQGSVYDIYITSFLLQ